MLYQMVELEEGVDVQYLGVYALKWRQEWGPPSVGFVERTVFAQIKYLCAHCGGFSAVSFRDVEVFDSGTTLTCGHCGEATIFDLGTPGKRAERYEEYKALQELLAVRDSELEQCNLNVEGSRKANVQLKEDLRLESDVGRRVCGRLAEAMERIKALEQRVREEKAWAQYRKDMYVAIRKQLRRAGVIKLHEEITVKDAVKRLLRQIPAGILE